MISPSDSNTPKLPAWLGALIPLLIILLVAGLFWYLIDKPDDSIDPDMNSGVSLSGKLKRDRLIMCCVRVKYFQATSKMNRRIGKKYSRYSLSVTMENSFESITE